jgi:hypothetical protein
MENKREEDGWMGGMDGNTREVQKILKIDTTTVRVSQPLGG